MKTAKDRSYVVDDNNNKAYIKYFRTIEKAREALDSLTNCKDCINCFDCKDCINCTGLFASAHIANLHCDTYEIQELLRLIGSITNSGVRDLSFRDFGILSGRIFERFNVTKK